MKRQLSLGFTFLLSLFCLPFLQAQSQRLAIEDLISWNRIESPLINANGDFSAHTLRPDYGDPFSVVSDHSTGESFVLPRVDQLRFSYDGAYLLGMVHPPLDTIRAYKHRDKAEALKKMDSLLVLELASGQQQRFPATYRFASGEFWSDIYAYTTTSLLADSLQKGLDKNARRLVIRRFGSSDSLSLEGVTQFQLAKRSPAIIATRPKNDSLWPSQVTHFNWESFSWNTVWEHPDYQIGGSAISEDGQRLAFLTTIDSLKGEQKPYSLFTVNRARTTEIVYDWLPHGYRISPDGQLEFSESGARVYFGISPQLPERDSGLLDEDVANVEVWTSQDARLYTQQNVLQDRERKRSYRCTYFFDQRSVSILSNPEASELVLPEGGDGDYALVYDERPYLQLLSWEGGPVRKDLYLVEVASGQRTKIATAVAGSPRWSPNEEYLYWYSSPDTAYQTFSLADRQIRTVTNNQSVPFYDELNDRPMHPSPYGVAGWAENDEALFIYDRYDWWRIDPQGKTAPLCLTQARNERVRLRYLQLDPEKEFFTASDRLLVRSFDEDNYHSGYHWLQLSDGTLTPLQTGPYSFGRRVLKAREAEAYLYTQEDFSTFPDLQFSEDLRESKLQVSDANPQQRNFAWGTAEPYEWTNIQGVRLRGTLIKPPNFDPNQRYPMIVNFYERSSERLYQHRAPFPHRSTINYSYYASRGYLIFNPDVFYRVGYPGESAYDCVMPGISKLIDEGFVDEGRIGLQGHSWGGYQAAYFLTKTDLFACAESGAPVVNMFSAYGGIRWGSGMSRQFQYERTQSRIGGTPWTHTLRYLENSPIFFTDKVNTPVLILHNDKDGAVPWYQGIEWFTALRRLNKPAWMLNYRGEPHWPLRHANRVDFQRRMSQFFDHYLQGARRPRWMDEGVSPLELGIEQGYELSRQ
ncbi:MAG: prolyl oligopeptidase family serine peptidase [Bacteroidota bacterium]